MDAPLPEAVPAETAPDLIALHNAGATDPNAPDGLHLVEPAGPHEYRYVGNADTPGSLNRILENLVKEKRQLLSIERCWRVKCSAPKKEIAPQEAAPAAPEAP